MEVSVKGILIQFQMTAEKSTLTRTDEFWMRSNPGNKEELSWDEYRAIQVKLRSSQPKAEYPYI